MKSTLRPRIQSMYARRFADVPIQPLRMEREPVLPRPTRVSDSGSCPRSAPGPARDTLVVNSMSWRSECHTEQYFSLESAIARSTCSAGALVSSEMLRSIDTKRRGSVSARRPVSRALNDRTSNRPFVRMRTMSMAMQPASDPARAATGEGPASFRPSSSHSWPSSRAVNINRPSHARSTTIGGFASAVCAIVPPHT